MGPVAVDQFARRIEDQIHAAVALDDDRRCAVMLKTLSGYLRAKEIEIRQTAWDADRAPPDPTISARYDGRCAACSGAIRVGDPIVHDAEARRTVHAACEGRA